MRIEPATSEDVDGLADAWVALAASQREHGSHIAADENRNTIRGVLAHHVVDGSVLVARPGAPGASGIIGFVNFGLEDAGISGDAVRGLVHNVYVEPGARDDGVGSALLDAAEAALVERGADVVAIEALAANEAARRLYERRGYRLHRVQYERTTESDTSTSEKG